ncbi:hypothetical protein L4D76_09720 [Photobacterium sagamiensis]|uniref:hypothetical protein n=1 Tax=Photobacterium sagamiensis TaxID=2910241 RepID=UPI003D0C3018
MCKIKTLVAPTPEVLLAFLQNRLECEYYIYCQFSADLSPGKGMLREAIGIEFQPADS